MRWINCPGSVRLSESYPSSSSVYADEGTIAHSVLEAGLNHDKDAFMEAETAAERFYAEHPDLDGSWTNITDNIGDMISWIDTEFEKERRIDPAVQIYSEQQVDLTSYIKGGFGTADVTIVRTGALHIVDLKYGKGVRVDAEGNTQLRLYALGMLDMLDDVYDIKDVRMTIYQPRLEHISTDEISAADLREWAEEVVRPAAKLALSRDAPFAAGSWCQFCPAKNLCRERADHNMELENYRIKTTLTDKEIGIVLGRVDELIRWADDLKAGALQKLQEGGEIPGWKVVEGRSIRRFSADEATIVSAARGAGYDKALLYETKMITLSAMEKMMGKKAFGEAMAGCIEKPPGKPTLAPESDKRPPLTGGNPAEVFADYISND